MLIYESNVWAMNILSRSFLEDAEMWFFIIARRMPRTDKTVSEDVLKQTNSRRQAIVRMDNSRQSIYFAPAMKR